jgi:chemotaxis signal transduction protein
MGTMHFAIDLQEVCEIVRLADQMHIEDTPWIVPGIIRRNRGNTLVLDLERCMRIQWGITDGKGKAGFIVLDEKTAGANIGVLLPGISTVMTVSPVRTRVSRPGPQRKNHAPIHGVIRLPGKRAHLNLRPPVIWIDCWKLVENCVLAGCMPQENMTRGG